MSTITILIPKSFHDHLDAAIVRASYLYPDLDIHQSQDSMSVEILTQTENFDREQLRKDFLNILYRERIYSETLGIRKTIYGAQ